MNKPSNFSDSQFRAIKRLIDTHLYNAANRALETAFDRRQPRFIHVGHWLATADEIVRLFPHDSKKPDGTWRLVFRDGNEWTMGAEDAKRVREQLGRSRL